VLVGALFENVRSFFWTRHTSIYLSVCLSSDLSVCLDAYQFSLSLYSLVFYSR
jgi:hypothetical protein